MVELVMHIEVRNQVHNKHREPHNSYQLEMKARPRAKSFCSTDYITKSGKLRFKADGLSTT